MSNLKRVFLAVSSNTTQSSEECEVYHQKCITHAFTQCSEAPMSAQMLDDVGAVGINKTEIIKKWLGVSDALIVYRDHGFGREVRQLIKFADEMQLPVEFRSLVYNVQRVAPSHDVPLSKPAPKPSAVVPWAYSHVKDDDILMVHGKPHTVVELRNKGWTEVSIENMWLDQNMTCNKCKQTTDKILSSGTCSKCFSEPKQTCYQCEKETDWLAPDSRCGQCTRLTPDEVKGL